MKQFYSKVLALVGLSLASLSVSAIGRDWSDDDYIKTDINSGNPAFPFPQFLEYKTGKSLAKYNAEGVTHADMEKTTREAYEIMSHRCRYEGGTHCGVPYITFNGKNVPSTTYSPYCTEGDGYMMLAAAIYADQPTFNGLWMYIHDYKIPNVIRYKDGEVNYPNYKIGSGLPIWTADENTNDKLTEYDATATDGDEDIAMALLMAYKQWGEFMMQDGKKVLDAKGDPISYKKAAEDILKAFVDTLRIQNFNLDGSIYDGGHMSGDIGIDGYVKSGNKFGDISNWRMTQTDFPEISKLCIFGSVSNLYFDYCAPSYYNEFAKWLESDDVEATDWQINQYKRAEASSDWLIGQAYEQGLIASIGKCNIDQKDDTKVTFSNFSEGEDFRAMWRTIQNYLWHGDSETTWDPKTHQVEKGANTYEGDMARRMASFLKNPNDYCDNFMIVPDPNLLKWWGPSQINQCYNMYGEVPNRYRLNYTVGASAAAIVANGDIDQVADMYRQSELMWDDASASDELTDDERYIKSTPNYFHGWFRVLGLVINSGNWHAPSNMNSAANMKVYMSVDKTYANVGDFVEYEVQCRNYGSEDALGVKIETEIDPNYEVVSISDGGEFVNGKIVWNIGSVPGFRTGHLAETMDTVSFRVVVRDTLNPRIALKSEISGTNFDNWTSNEYPNNATYTMERNMVDIVNNEFATEITFDKREAVPGDVVTATVSFASNGQKWLNGGRNHVNFTHGNKDVDYSLFLLSNIYNDAYEAYIDLGNYRFSYYMHDDAVGLFDEEENPTGWSVRLDNNSDLEKYGYNPESAKIYSQLIHSNDSTIKCNQRFIVQLPQTLIATTSYMQSSRLYKYMIHKGAWGAESFRIKMSTNPIRRIEEFLDDDWSYDKSLEVDYFDGRELYTPVSPSYASDDLGQEVTSYARYSCTPLENVFDRVMVEEFDGYAWRRILGEGFPTLGVHDVESWDTIPAEFEFAGWVDSTIFGSVAKYYPEAEGSGYTGVIKCSVPECLNGIKDKLVYKLKIKEAKSSVAEKEVVSDVDVSSSVGISKTSASLLVKYELSDSKSVANDAYKVYAKNGELVVVFNDSDEHELTVTNALGSISKYTGVSGTFNISLVAGVYMVSVDGETQKVVVK
ncbi:MAG: glycosyl hydrolase family 8 [Paludibacteraceae bacterium]|nr:glycosyl hydrolase family 8 [Paludibacteraceae bacterium]